VLRRRHGAHRPTFLPTAVRAIDLGVPLTAVVLGPADSGASYGDVALLVRLHGDPLAFVTVGLRAGRLAVGDLAAAIWAAAGDRVADHARRWGCLSENDLGAEALERGLPPAGTGCPGARPHVPAAPAVTVIVPTAGRAAFVADCLGSLRDLRYPRYEVLVVDNRPADPSTRQLVEEVARTDARIRYLAEPRPGSSVARNAGIANTRADLVAFTDDDVAVEPDWLDWLVEPFIQDPDVDAVTGLVLPAELETRAQLWFEQYGGFGKGFERRVYDLDRNRADDRLLFPYWGGLFGSGNSMVFRRRALAAVGGFDPALGVGSPARAGADIEAFTHVILRGGRLVYQPRSICWHRHRRDEAGLRRQLFSYGVGFTAILTKWTLRDRRVLVAMGRELMRAVPRRLAPARLRLRQRPDLPRRLSRLEMRGYLVGPLLYLRSLLWSRRRRLAAALPGEASGGAIDDKMPTITSSSRDADALSTRLAETRHRGSPHRKVRVISPAPRDAWEGVLASDPNALLSHTPAWMDFVCGYGSYEDASRLYDLPGGRRLVLPMVRRRLPGPLASEGSYPTGLGMGGIIASGGTDEADVATVFRELAGRQVVRTMLRPGPLVGEPWSAARPRSAVVVPRIAHVLELDGGFDMVWKKRFAGAARTAVRKAEKSSLTVERDTTGRLVPVLYELYERSLDRWAEQQHEPRALARWRGHRRDPRRKFELMAEMLGDACHIWIAWHEGRPVAGILVLHGANASYSRGMMDKEPASRTRANDLLQQLAIKEACEAGCRYYDMGESGTSDRLAHFKSRFGATVRHYADYHLERLPITALDRRARQAVKRVIGFRD
jgi:GT2 family glycosyltransferase